jgi:hypothetical protein
MITSQVQLGLFLGFSFGPIGLYVYLCGDTKVLITGLLECVSVSGGAGPPDGLCFLGSPG